MDKKYKLVNKARLVPPHWTSESKRTFWRIQALRNIPEHNVKVGDLGGYVSSKNILSHEGNCWVAYGASILGNVRIADNAYIGNNASVTNDFTWSSVTVNVNAQILDQAEIYISRIGGHPIISMSITDNVIISGSAIIASSATIAGNSKITGNAKICRNVMVFGDSLVCDNAVINNDATISDMVVSGSSQVGEGESFSGAVFNDDAIYVNKTKTLKTISFDKATDTIQSSNENAKPALTINSASNKKTLARVNHFNQVKAKIESYELDIVKIIKYPLMTDKTNVYTRDMAIAFNKAERLLPDGDKEFEDAVAELEAKFLSAESNAIKVASSQLTVSELKKVATAKDMFSIASNDAAGDHERKVAFTQGFKQLEGILTVPENTVDAFRVTIGMKEIGA